MRQAIYIETSIPSYLTARPSRDVRVAAWQQLTSEWWEQERQEYDLFVSELVLAEAGQGDASAAKRRLAAIADIELLPIDEDVQSLAEQLITAGGMPASAEADALHVAVAAMHRMDYLLTWNCRHIDNAATKPIIRSICAVAGFSCPEICTPMELFSGD